MSHLLKRPSRRLSIVVVLVISMLALGIGTLTHPARGADASCGRTRRRTGGGSVRLHRQRPHSPAPTWIHAGARHAEAGYLDPALGWIGVRADTAGGEMHASLLPASSDAAQVLGSHLAGLNDYLTRQHGEAVSVTMAAPQEFAGPGTSAQQQQERHSSQEPTPSTKEPEFPAAHRDLHVPAPAAAQAYAVGARYISVMA